MKIWICIQLIFGVIGTMVLYFIGGFDGLVYTLVVFVLVDYVTGIAKAIVKKKLSSNIGYKGILKKILIFALVGIAHTLDKYIFNFSMNDNNILRNIVICFFIANEGLSILENAALTGVPIPEKLKDMLLLLRDKSNKK